VVLSPAPWKLPNPPKQQTSESGRGSDVDENEQQEVIGRKFDLSFLRVCGLLLRSNRACNSQKQCLSRNLKRIFIFSGNTGNNACPEILKEISFSLGIVF